MREDGGRMERRRGRRDERMEGRKGEECWRETEKGEGGRRSRKG